MRGEAQYGPVRLITLRYQAVCHECGLTVEAGARVRWYPEIKKVRHANCETDVDWSKVKFRILEPLVPRDQVEAVERMKLRAYEQRPKKDWNEQ